MTQRLFVIVVAFIGLLGFLIRFFMSIDPSIWADEGQHVWIVGVNHWYEMRKVYETTAHDQPFGLYIALYIWKNIFSWSQVSMRCFSAFFSAASIPLIARYSHKLLGDKMITLFTASLLCFSPLSIRYGYDVTPYALVQFLAVISTGQFLLAIKNKNYGFTMSHVLVNMCLLNVHYFSYFFVFAQVLIFLMYSYKNTWQKKLTALVYPCMFYVFASIPMFLLFDPTIAKGNHWWIGLENRSSIEVFSNLVLYQDLLAWGVLATGLIFLVKKQFFEQEKPNLSMVYPLLGINAVMVFIVYVAGLIAWKVSGNERYYIALLPSIILIFSIVLGLIPKQKIKYAMFALLVGLFVYDAYKSLPRQNYQDFDSAMHFIKKDDLNSQGVQKVMFIPECCRWGIYYYQAQKNLQLKNTVLPLANFINNEDQRYAFIQKLKAEGYQRMYTVLYYESLKHKHLLMDTMKQHGQIITERSFHGVCVLIHTL
ncbi:glycosyltransferase family 39 protein [bacterium]|nr:glycosyltransferase family 39 protein [bacterium]